MLGYIRYCALRYRSLEPYIEQDELIHEGLLGYYQAEKNYDINNETGAGLLTYASKYIKGKMYEYVRKNMHTHEEYIEDEEKDSTDILEELILEEETILLATSYNTILNKRERGIILGRISGKTLEELGKEYGVSCERIRQLELISIRKLRKEFI